MHLQTIQQIHGHKSEECLNVYVLVNWWSIETLLLLMVEEEKATYNFKEYYGNTWKVNAIIGNRENDWWLGSVLCSASG